MRGHIRQRSPGHWAIILDVGNPETGKRRQRWISFTGSKRHAQIRCTELVAELQNGSGVDPSHMTVSAFLERWLEHMKGQVAPRTLERYAEISRKNLGPLLGKVVLEKLRPAHISQAYAKALTSGRRDGTGGLSARTVTHMHRVLREALQQAVQWQMLARNPAAVVKPPKIERTQIMKVLDAAGTAELIEAARGYTIFMPILLGALCGMRRGEICSLRWRSIDVESGQLAVIASMEQTEAGCREKETKSGRNRTIALPAMVVEELRQHRIVQAEQMLRLGVRLTPEYHVVMRADGTPLQPNSMTHAFATFVAARGLKRIRFHDLRHTHATQMLRAGIHPKIASERLGHSKVGITLDLYSHVLPGMQDEAAVQVNALISGEIERQREAAAKKTR
jgi:integrase